MSWKYKIYLYGHKKTEKPSFLKNCVSAIRGSDKLKGAIKLNVYLITY